MGLYRVNRTGTPTGNADFMVITSAASRRIRIKRIIARGAGSSSAAQAVQVFRSSGGATPGTSLNISKEQHSDQPTQAFTATQAWGTPPTKVSNGEPVGWNAVGGGNTNNVLPNTCEARNGDSLSVFVPTDVTPQACEISVIVEED